MTKKRQSYKVYTREFKQSAVQMLEEGRRPASEIAMELGIRRNQCFRRVTHHP
jgi:transposase